MSHPRQGRPGESPRRIGAATSIEDEFVIRELARCKRNILDNRLFPQARRFGLAYGAMLVQDALGDVGFGGLQTIAAYELYRTWRQWPPEQRGISAGPSDDSIPMDAVLRLYDETIARLAGTENSDRSNPAEGTAQEEEHPGRSDATT